ncbi:MAG TPA: ATP-binding cassette domain-containing protein [Aquifex aeolicus]|nr:ATP-binding cassette domain-containing protein [Aquifex aeolicus]
MNRTVVLEHVYKEINGREILKDITFDVKEGEIFSIIGRSGSGKTSITKLIVGLWKPTKGKVVVFGKEIPKISKTELEEVRKQIGYVFQEGALFDSYKVWENVVFYYLEKENRPKDELMDLALEKLRMVNLDERVLDLYPSDLSGGMRKRVAIARALATEPKLVIYDEPTSGLDPITSRRIDELVVELRGKTGSTALIVTHDMISAFTISDRVLVIREGKIRAIGKPEEVIKNPDPYIQSFVGDIKDCLKTLHI